MAQARFRHQEEIKGRSSRDQGASKGLFSFSGPSVPCQVLSENLLFFVENKCYRCQNADKEDMPDFHEIKDTIPDYDIIKNRWTTAKQN
jgi:hypothetical protein